jgi:hypothetical protein
VSFCNTARWEALAQQKLAEVDEMIRQAQAMKRVPEEELLRCRCLTKPRHAWFTHPGSDADR